MSVYTAPEKFLHDGRFTIFLAGSIEMGKAEDWQQEAIHECSFFAVDILNPRRKNWNPEWVQSRDNLEFVEQVEWELYGLGMADLIIMYLQPGTVSPISLLELGLFAKSGKMIVCCPDDFQRSGNVQIVCERERIPFYKNKHEMFYALRNILKRKA